MTLRRAALALLLSILASLAGLSAQVVTLRIAANVPANSPWDLGLKRLAVEFDRVSGGRVRIVFPPSAHVSSEEDMLQQMRLGTDGALISSQGLAQVYPDSLALSMPSFIADDEEFDAVLKAVGPLIDSKLAGRYVVLALSKGGWVRYFSRSPIVYPSDLAGLRVSLDQGNDSESRLLQSVGSRLVPGSISDFLLQINTNEVDAVCESPIYIATLWFQLRGKISYMSSFKVAPFIGAMIVNQSSWERVPADLRPALRRTVQDIADRTGLDSAKLEEEAIASLDGIRIPPEPPDAAAKWAKIIAERRDGLIARMFSPDILDTMDAALAEVRDRRRD
jgi:TRAP-type C4-dicarboxylate transport system substrate-binding protein